MKLLTIALFILSACSTTTVTPTDPVTTPAVPTPVVVLPDPAPVVPTPSPTPTPPLTVIPTNTPCTTTVQAGASISAALSAAKPGDTVCLADGTWTTGASFSKSGTQGAYIILRAVNAGKAKLTAGLSLGAASYIGVSGLDVTNASYAGIYTAGCTSVATCGHHILVINNNVHDCQEGGLHIGPSDYRYIVGNTTYRNAFTNSDASSGISLWHSVDVVTTDTNPWGKGFRNYVANNRSFGNDNCVRNADDSYATPLHCISSATDGNGIIIDDNKNTQPTALQGPYKGNFLVENNLVYDNGGAGVHSFLSANVTFRNNIAFWNHRRVSSGTWKGDLSNVQSDNNTWIGNTGVANPCFNAANSASLDVQSTGSVWSGNVLSTSQSCIK